MAWMIEKRELGYRPFQDSDWGLYSCTAYGKRSDADEVCGKLRKYANEYEQFRVSEYRRVGDGQ